MSYFRKMSLDNRTEGTQETSELLDFFELEFI